jgi:hypothetical protein
VALKQERRDGSCRWLTRSGRFEKGPCNERGPHFLRAKGSRDWRYRLSESLPASRRSRIVGYVLYARADCNCSPFRGRGDKHPFEIR